MFIITLITCICVCAGIGIHIFGALDDLWRWLQDDDNPVMDTQEDWDVSGMTIDIDAHSLVMDVDVADVHVVYGMKFTVSYDATRELEPIIEVKDDTLYISQKKGHKIIPSRQYCGIYVTIPEDLTLETCQLDVDVAEVTVKGICAKDAEFRQDVGNLKVTDSRFSHVTTDLDVGNLEMENVTMENLNATLDTGDVKLTAVSAETFQVTSSIGDVDITTVDDCASYGMDLQTDAGSVHVSGTKQGNSYFAEGKNKMLTVKSDIGDIPIR